MKKQLLPAALIAIVIGGSATAFAWTAGVIGPRRVSGGTVANALEYNLGGAKPAPFARKSPAKQMPLACARR